MEMSEFLSLGSGLYNSDYLVGIVLAVLLQSLEFTLPKDKEIGWNVGLLMTPVVKGSESIHCHLPLIIKKRGV